jgi:hypothetical protein
MVAMMVATAGAAFAQPTFSPDTCARIVGVGGAGTLIVTPGGQVVCAAPGDPTGPRN